jgi:hypothetical protein
MERRDVEHSTRVALLCAGGLQLVRAVEGHVPYTRPHDSQRAVNDDSSGGAPTRSGTDRAVPFVEGNGFSFDRLNVMKSGSEYESIEEWMTAHIGFAIGD